LVRGGGANPGAGVPAPMAPGVSTAAEEFTVASFDLMGRPETLGTGGTIHPASIGTPGGFQILVLSWKIQR